ncbi:stage III sporulation protein AG [Flavonifractor sp. HCP28S3_F3]|uniref:stage III sporulation protein AG n=1 Tax=Flavonifractor sp. HCP28S3_F3 TaxID=3438939 RepID=UPI003F89F9B1
MKKTDLLQWKKRLDVLFQRYKYVLLVILVGAVLLLLPPLWEKDETKESTAESQTGQAGETADSVADLEQRLEEALSQIQGVGEADVILTLKSGPQKVLAQDSDTSISEQGTESTLSSVIVSQGSGVEDAIVIQQLSPQYQGALVVCSGGANPEVRLRLVEAVSALTGLGADKISVCKGK